MNPTTVAILAAEPGGPEVLQLGTRPLPAPAPGELQVRHLAVGVNFIDTYHRSGLYPLPTWPLTPGVEASGIIEAVGDGVDGWAVGQRLAYVARAPGAYAAARNILAADAVPLPAEVDAAVAASLMVKGITAAALLEHVFPVQPGQTVLIHAAAGGMGLALVPWARALGATVLGTTSSAAKADLALQAGCHHVIRYDHEPVAAQVRELTEGQGVHVVYDGVGRDTFQASLDSLRPRGMLVAFGQASGLVPPFDLRELARRGSLFLTRPSMFDYIQTPAELRALAARAFAQLAATAASPSALPLSQAAEAHRLLEARLTTGALVLIP